MAAVWDSTVQQGISTFISVTPLDILNNMFGNFSAVFLTRCRDNFEVKNQIFFKHNNVHYQHLFWRWRRPPWIIVSKLSKNAASCLHTKKGRGGWGRMREDEGGGGAASQWYPTLVPIQRSGLLFYFFLPCLPLCRCQSFISGSLSFTSPQDISSLLLLSLSHCFSSFWPTPRHSDTWTPPTCPSPRACLLLQGCKRSTLYLFIYLFI